MFYASYKRYWEPSTPYALLIGTVAGTVATTVSYPLEYLKTKVQIRNEMIGLRQRNLETGVNAFRVYRSFLDAGYPASHAFTGFAAGLAGRLSFLAVRNTVYKLIYDAKKPSKPTNDLNYEEKTLISGISGAVAALLTNGFDIVSIRQISDLGRPQEFKRNYSTVADGLRSIAKEAGPGPLRGIGVSMTRAFVMNAVMIYPYNTVKEHLYNIFGDVWVNSPLALAWASVVATALTLPIDHVRTKMLNQFENPALNRANYLNAWDCVIKTCEVEGLNAFYVGTYPFFLKTFLYGAATIYVSDLMCYAGKKNAGLEEKYM